MVAVKVKEAAMFMPRFLNQLERLDGVNRAVFVYGESTDASLRMLKHYQKTSRHQVEIYREPYLPEAEKHPAMLARVKHDIQRILKAGTEDYYLSFDPDVVQFPPDLIAQLKRCGADVTAPMVWVENRTIPTFFDTFMFRRNGCMFHPYEPPGLGRTEPFQIDSFGCACGLITREAELAGKYVNPYPNIGFCKSLIDQGFKVMLDPRVHVYHVDLEAYGIMHYPIESPYSHVPFLTTSGDKQTLQHVAGCRKQYMVNEYDKWLKQEKNAEVQAVSDWWNTRPLITASYKVFNEESFLKYSLESIYPFVDRVDIVEGAMEASLGKANKDGSSTDGTVQLIKEFPDPQHKIRLIQGKWKSREHIQAKLLEVCESKWMLYIDGDEILDGNSMRKARAFCMQNQDGKIVYARPERFFTFWHDFKHIAYSKDPLSPWAQYGVPHPFLLWTDIPGLSFNYYHTIPTDGWGLPITLDRKEYRKKQAVLDGVFVYHFGNAKGDAAVEYKLSLPDHSRMVGDVDVDPYFSGVMPKDFGIEEFKGKLPAVLRKHPCYGKQRIRVTDVNPYKFELLQQ